MPSKCRKCHFRDLKFKNVSGRSPRTPLEMQLLNLNVRPPCQETLDPLLDIMTSTGPPKRYFAPGPTEPLGCPAPMTPQCLSQLHVCFLCNRCWISGKRRLDTIPGLMFDHCCKTLQSLRFVFCFQWALGGLTTSDYSSCSKLRAISAKLLLKFKCG